MIAQRGSRRSAVAEAMLARSSGLRAALERVGLPAWFIVIDVLWVLNPNVVGIDARHYQRAAAAWLNGGNPWAITESGVPFAAGPHTLLFYAPTSVLHLDVSVVLWSLAGVAAAAWTVHRLGLPIWWMLFPPLLHAMWNANPQTIMLALLVAATPVAGAVAAGLKLYALLPLAFHPRRLIAAVVILGITLLVLPWQLYLEQGLGVGSHLTTAWNGSAWRIPLLVPLVLVALLVLRRRGADWFAVPAVFPATQFYYVSTALPALVGRPVLAALFAAPVPLLVPVAVLWLAARELRHEAPTA